MPVEAVGYVVSGFALGVVFYWFGRAVFCFYNVFK